MLTDFGSACPLAIPVDMPDEGEELGTPSFTAPELLLPTKFGLEKGGPSKEADVYALGMTMYQVMTGKRPFLQIRKAAIIRAVISGERPAKPHNAEEIGMTDAFWDLLRECWREDRKKRPRILHILTRVKDITSLYPLPSIPSVPSVPSTPSPPPGVVGRDLGRMPGRW